MKKILLFLVFVAALSGWGGFIYQQIRINDLSRQFQERISQLEHKQKITEELRQAAESKRMDEQFALQQEYQRVLEESVTRELDGLKFRQDSYQARVDQILEKKSRADENRLTEFSALIAALRTEQDEFKAGQEALMRRLEGSIGSLERFFKDELAKTNNQLTKYSVRLDNTMDKLETAEREIERYREKVSEYKRDLDAYKQLQSAQSAAAQAPPRPSSTKP